jgi:DNA damage-binding protein 1
MDDAGAGAHYALLTDKQPFLPRFILGTATGGMHVLANVSDSMYLFLLRIETALRQVVSGVGGLGQFAWRSWNVQHRVEAKSVGFVDGDLVETFLDLDRSAKERVVNLINNDGQSSATPVGSGPVTVESLQRIVEELSRVH